MSFGAAGQYVSDRGVRPQKQDITDLTGTASSQRYTFTLRTEAVRVSVSTAEARIAFGDDTITVAANSGIMMQDGMTDVFVLPPNATDMAYIGDTAVINVVELA